MKTIMSVTSLILLPYVRASRLLRMGDNEHSLWISIALVLDLFPLWVIVGLDLTMWKLGTLMDLVCILKHSSRALTSSRVIGLIFFMIVLMILSLSLSQLLKNGWSWRIQLAFNVKGFFLSSMEIDEDMGFLKLVKDDILECVEAFGGFDDNGEDDMAPG